MSRTVLTVFCISLTGASFTDARAFPIQEGLAGRAGGGPDRSVMVELVASTRALDGNELLKIGDLHEVQNHFLEALPYYRRALATFRARKDRRGEATALVRIGQVQERQGRHAEAYASLHEAAPLLEATEDGAHAKALLSLGFVSESLGKVAEAQRAYEGAGGLFLRMQDRSGYTDSLIRLGSLFIAQNQATEGLATLQKALKDARDREDHGQELAILTRIGDSHMKGAERGAALAVYEEGLKLAETQRDVRAEAALRVRLAKLYGADDRSAEGAKFAWRALALYQSLKDRSQEADTWSLLGNLHQEEGNWTLALEYHERALALYRALRDPVREAASLVNLATAYEAQGSRQEAVETKRKAIHLLQPRPQ